MLTHNTHVQIFVSFFYKTFQKVFASILFFANFISSDKKVIKFFFFSQTKLFFLLLNKPANACGLKIALFCIYKVAKSFLVAKRMQKNNNIFAFRGLEKFISKQNMISAIARLCSLHAALTQVYLCHFAKCSEKITVSYPLHVRRESRSTKQYSRKKHNGSRYQMFKVK